MFGEAIIGSDWGVTAGDVLQATDARRGCSGKTLSIAESPLDSAGGRILVIHDITTAHEPAPTLSATMAGGDGRDGCVTAHQLRTPLADRLLYSANLAQPELSETARARFAGKATSN